MCPSKLIPPSVRNAARRKTATSASWSTIGRDPGLPSPNAIAATPAREEPLMTVSGRPAGGLNPPRPTRLPVAGNQEQRHAQGTVNTDLGSIRGVAPPDRPACARWESQRHAGNRLANKPAARRATVNAIFGLDVASWPEKIDPHKLRDWCRVRRDGANYGRSGGGSMRNGLTE